MTDISKIAPPNHDTVYSKIVGNDVFGELVSRIHAAVIRNGNELEAFLNTSTLLVKPSELSDLLSANRHDGTYIIGKNSMRALKCYIHSKYEPDFVVLQFEDGKAKIIEVKLGDKFDTKKSQGEVSHLRRFAWRLRRAYPELKTSIHICMFYQENKKDIVAGTHNAFKINQAMTGRELCAILDVDYDSQLRLRELDWDKNKKFIAQQLIQDSELKTLLSKLIETSEIKNKLTAQNSGDDKYFDNSF